jgi:hypothetical protein
MQAHCGEGFIVDDLRTPYWEQLKNSVFLFESINERPYVIYNLGKAPPHCDLDSLSIGPLPMVSTGPGFLENPVFHYVLTVVGRA